MRAFAGIVAVLSLGACVQELGPAGDMLARDAAKGVVNTVVRTRFPGLNAAPVTDCIIDNATIPEVVAIAEAAVTGVTPATTNLVVEIASRPETVRCISTASFGL